MNYRNILLLSTFWTLMSPLLEARDVFAAEYNPRTELREDEQQDIARVQFFIRMMPIKVVQKFSACFNHQKRIRFYNPL